MQEASSDGAPVAARVVLAPSYGLASAASWGAGDFAGGLAARRVPPLRIALVVQVAGAIVVAAVALILREPWPMWADVAWAAAAGLSGTVGLVALYGALASGRMGIAAPLAGLLTALVPVVAGIANDGAPALTTMGGFVLALAGVALVAGPRAERPAPRTLALAALAGLGFGGFLVLVAQTGEASTWWVLFSARAAAAPVVLALALWRGEARGALPALAFLAALLDLGGNVFFLMAERAGRLDVAAVLSSLYPLATALLARIVLKERLSWTQGVGIGLVVASLPLLAA